MTAATASRPPQGRFGYFLCVKGGTLVMGSDCQFWPNDYGSVLKGTAPCASRLSIPPANRRTL